MTPPTTPSCPACGRAAPLTGPCGQCGGDLTALQLLWGLPAAAPPAPRPAAPRAAWLAPLVAGLGVGLCGGVLVGLALSEPRSPETGVVAGPGPGAVPAAPSSPAAPLRLEAPVALAGDPVTALNPGGTPAAADGSPAAPVRAGAAPDPADSPPAPQVRLHRIVAGDTLGALALKAYGDEDRFDVLLAANPGIRPRALRIGTTLRIPPPPIPPRSTP